MWEYGKLKLVCSFLHISYGKYTQFCVDKEMHVLVFENRLVKLLPPPPLPAKSPPVSPPSTSSTAPSHIPTATPLDQRQRMPSPLTMPRYNILTYTVL